MNEGKADRRSPDAGRKADAPRSRWDGVEPSSAGASQSEPWTSGRALSGTGSAATSVWLILSSEYVDQELAAEFGRLPPCFLPVGMRRLFEYQLERLGAGGEVWITLPESFELPAADLAVLNKAQVNLLAIPDGLSLGEALVYACNLVGGGDRPIHVLHGDTLLDPDFAGKADEIGIADTDDGYSWAEVECDGSGNVESLRTVIAGVPSEREHPVACGYFSFSSIPELVRCVVRSRGSFIEGINLYAKERGLRAVRVGNWYDFGHLRTFYRSRRFITTARAFNSLQIDDGIVRKLSQSSSDKISAEANWYSAVPPALRIYTARMIACGITGDGLACYDTEYEHLPTVAELFVFGSLDRPSWNNILNSCCEFLRACSAVTTASADGSQALRALVREKTVERLQSFGRETDCPVDRELRYGGRPVPSLLEIARDVSDRIDDDDRREATIMHGDFCFSNILYNPRVRRVRVIDPRGYVEPGRHDIYGDTRYDVAKLGHSIIGRYDHIVAGRYSLSATAAGDYEILFDDAPHHRWVESAYRELSIGRVQAGSEEVLAVIVSLFLSMLPLHADQPQRQRAFIANALRLYLQLQSG